MNYEQFFFKLIENANDKNLLLNPKMTPELQSIVRRSTNLVIENSFNA